EYKGGTWGFTSDSEYKAINALFDHFKPWHRQQRIRVASMSWSRVKHRRSLRGIIEGDQHKYDRIYICSASTHGQNSLRYPAAHDNVLGVSGIWRDKSYNSGLWYDQIAGSGSNFRNDGFTAYPVSGVFDFWDSSEGRLWYGGRSTSPPGTLSYPDPLYDDFN